MKDFEWNLLQYFAMVKKIFNSRALKRTRMKDFGLNLIQYFAMVEENFKFMSSETYQSEGFWVKKLIQHFTNGFEKILNLRALKRTRMKDFGLNLIQYLTIDKENFQSKTHQNKGFWLNLIQYLNMGKENFQFKISETHQNEGFLGKSRTVYFLRLTLYLLFITSLGIRIWWYGNIRDNAKKLSRLRITQ